MLFVSGDSEFRYHLESSFNDRSERNLPILSLFLISIIDELKQISSLEQFCKDIFLLFFL